MDGLKKSFDVNCGIRQGCPFSPLPFIIGIELLAIKLRSNITRLEFTNKRILRLLMYADDMTLFFNNEMDIRKAIDMIDDFTYISGLNLNKNKSEAMGLGNFELTGNDFDLKWVKEIKILGIYFCSANCASKNDKKWKN